MAAILSDEAAAFLDANRIARLGTADPRARPHVVPLCYARDGAALYFIVDEKPKAVGRTLERLRNIAANPEVALVIDRYEEDWTRLEYVMVRGRAETVCDPEEFSRGLGLLRARYPQYRTMRLEWERNALIKISITAVHHWRAS